MEALFFSEGEKSMDAKISEKYGRSYFMPPEVTFDWAEKDTIEKPPVWCSVDLRDGNQALIEPMSLEEKLEFFQMLVKVGFKEIEVGFPAASDTEYRFLRELIERKMIPEDVTIQVLTQAREHIIRKTFEAVQGAPHAVVHLYNSTSVAQREQVFHKSKEEVEQLAVDGAKLLKWLHRHRAGIRRGSLQRRAGCLEACAGKESHHQYPHHGAGGHAPCVRLPGGISA